MESDAPESKDLLRSALHSKHVAAGAKMSEVAGWEMPLSYGSTLEEVRRVHGGAGVFDISHLGRIRIRGGGAVDLLQRVCTADAAHQEDDTALHTLLCNDSGGVIDDCWLVRVEGFWLLTTNACNRRKVLAHLQGHAADFDVKIDDQTERTTQVLVAGARAKDMLDAVLPEKPSALPRRAVKVGSLMIARYVAMRVGYCNQWSLEVILPNMVAAQAWRFITEKADQHAIAPAGLAARDVLRIEAGLCRYGHELNETIDPMTACLEAAVDFSHEFIGAGALRKVRDRQPSRKRIGLLLRRKAGTQAAAIPKQGSLVRAADRREIGTVTSGTFSPALKCAAAMAYVGTEAAEAGTELLVEINSESHPAKVARLPFHP